MRKVATEDCSRRDHYRARTGGRPGFDLARRDVEQPDWLGLAFDGGCAW